MEDPIKFSKMSKACQGCLCIVDSILSILVFSPIVVGYWRGCWQLMDLYLIPDNAFYSLYASLAIGIGFGVFFALFQDYFVQAFSKQNFSISYLLFSRLYTIVYCISCVNHWRGVWNAWDRFTGTSWESGAASTLIGLFTLCLTRGVKNILAPPFVVLPDHFEGYFVTPTLFGTKKEKCGFFILDTFFSVVVTGSLIVFVWRGSWIFLDRKLFPNSAVYSAFGSLVIGLTVTILSFLAQLIMIPCLRSIKKGVWKIMLEDVYFTLCFIGAVNMWRGVWNLLNIYLYPGDPYLSNLITSVGGNFVLMLFCCANTIVVKGAQMDGVKEGSKGVRLGTDYLRCFFKKSLQKKKVHRRNRLSANGSDYLEVSISKSNGLLDGRGIGDGNSYSGAVGDTSNDFPVTMDFEGFSNPDGSSVKNPVCLDRYEKESFI